MAGKNAGDRQLHFAIPIAIATRYGLFTTPYPIPIPHFHLSKISSVHPGDRHVPYPQPFVTPLEPS